MRSKILHWSRHSTGRVRDHHRHLLTLQLGHIDFLETQSEALNSGIASCMNDFESRGWGGYHSLLPYTQ